MGTLPLELHTVPGSQWHISLISHGPQSYCVWLHNLCQHQPGKPRAGPSPALRCCGRPGWALVSSISQGPTLASSLSDQRMPSGCIFRTNSPCVASGASCGFLSASNDGQMDGVRGRYRPLYCRRIKGVSFTLPQRSVLRGWSLPCPPAAEPPPHRQHSGGSAAAAPWRCSPLAKGES